MASFIGLGAAVWTKSATEKVAIVFGGYMSAFFRKTYSFEVASGKWIEEVGLELPLYDRFFGMTVQTVDEDIYVMGADRDYSAQNGRSPYGFGRLLVLRKFGTAWEPVMEARAWKANSACLSFLISTWNPPKLRNP